MSILNIDGLLDREFKWGVHDCFALGRDLYKLNFDIDIKNYARPHDWRADHANLILSAYEREGFEKICDWKLKDLRPADIMCMAINESNANHFGIYLGNNEFIHHMYGTLSRISPMKGHWLHHTCFLLRHPDVPDLTPVPVDIPLEELLRARRKI